jgi:adenosine/AMP kinase
MVFLRRTVVLPASGTGSLAIASALAYTFSRVAKSGRGTVEFTRVPIEKPAEMNIVLGHSHFIKTVEDIHEMIVTTAPQMKFGLAFCEASEAALVRFSGNDDRLIDMAKRNALALAAGHAFILFLEGGFPVNILNALKNVPEVCRIFCATANPVEVVVAESELGRGIMGVIDGFSSKGVEGAEEIAQRKELLRTIGYKF